MKYKALVNQFSEGRHYIAGELYDASEIKHLDQNDFEAIGSSKSEAKRVAVQKTAPAKRGRKGKK